MQYIIEFLLFTLRKICFIINLQITIRKGVFTLKKINVAIIGQGRSGKNIHGVYFLSSSNEHYEVKYVVELDGERRAKAEESYPGCTALSDYRELYGKNDVDLVVNSTYSDMHFPITKDLIEHGFNVLVEKPFGRSRSECELLIRLAKEHGVTLAVFQQSFFAPFYTFTLEKIREGILGDVKQISIRYNGFARRWDWQTLQKKCAGGLYNTGPHPVGLALGYLDFDRHTRVEFSRLDTALTSGDGDDYAKVILSAPDKPVVDIEVISCDAFSDYNIKIIGSRGTLKCTTKAYKLTYIKDGENEPREVIEESLKNERGEPIYCSEKLVKHEESGEFSGTAFDVGTSTLYDQLYFKLTEGRKMEVTAEMARDVIGVIETVHSQNPLPVKF